MPYIFYFIERSELLEVTRSHFKILETTVLFFCQTQVTLCMLIFCCFPGIVNLDKNFCFLYYIFYTIYFRLGPCHENTERPIANAWTGEIGSGQVS